MTTEHESVVDKGILGFVAEHSVMKKFVSFLVLLNLILFTLIATAGPADVPVVTEVKPAKLLPTLAVPKAITFDKGPGYLTRVEPVVISTNGTASYWAYSSDRELWMNFIAAPDGSLRGLRVGASDTFLFVWGVWAGEDRPNSVTTDLEAWRKLFSEKVAFRPFRLEN